MQENLETNDRAVGAETKKLADLIRMMLDDASRKSAGRRQARRKPVQELESICWRCMRITWKGILCDAPESPPQGAVVLDLGECPDAGYRLQVVAACPAAWLDRAGKGDKQCQG